MEFLPEDPDKDEMLDLSETQVPVVRVHRLTAQRSSIGQLDSDTAEVKNSWLQQAQAAHVELGQCAVGQLSGNVAKAKSSAVAQVGVEELDVSTSFLGLASARRGHCERSLIGVLNAEGKVEASGGIAGVISAREVHAQNVKAAVVISPSVEGEFQALMGLREAAVFGAVFALVFLFLRWLSSR